jgi:hypothetical protein
MANQIQRGDFIKQGIVTAGVTAATSANILGANEPL